MGGADLVDLGRIMVTTVYPYGEDFPILFHCGDSRTDFSSPWRLARVLDTFPHLKIIAAHFGGYSEWGEVWKHLTGRKLWFDTSSTLWKLPVEEALLGLHIYYSSFHFYSIETIDL